MPSTLSRYLNVRSLAIAVPTDGADASGWRVASGVAVVHSPDRVAIITTARPAQNPVILQDAAAYLWAALEEGSADLSAEAAAAGISTDEVKSFVAGLHDLGLIEPVSVDQAQ